MSIWASPVNKIPDGKNSGIPGGAEINGRNTICITAYEKQNYNTLMSVQFKMGPVLYNWAAAPYICHLFLNAWPNFWVLLAKCRSAVVGLLLDCRWTVVGLSLDCRWTVVGLSLDWRWTVVGLSLDCRWTVVGLSCMGAISREHFRKTRTNCYSKCHYSWESTTLSAQLTACLRGGGGGGAPLDGNR
jgi:hypothetical protein